MISKEQFSSLSQWDKLSCVREIFDQIDNPSPSLADTKELLSSDFPFAEDTLTKLYDMVSSGIEEGKQLDAKKISDYISNMKLESKKAQEADSKKADELLMNELLEQSPDDTIKRALIAENMGDAKRAEIINTTADNGKLEPKEREWLNSKNELRFRGWYNFLAKDIIATNMRQLTSNPDVYTRLDSMINTTRKRGEKNRPYRLLQVKDENSKNTTQIDHINKVFNKRVQGMKTAWQNKVTRRIVAVNTLLMLNDRSLKNVSDFSLFSDSTIKAMHQYQKNYKEMNKKDDYSKADCIFGYRTVQQLMYNAKIKIISGKALNQNFDNKTNENAKKIDKESWYERKAFVVDGLNTYKAYLWGLYENMWLKLFTWSDTKLQDHMKLLDNAILEIKNKNLTDVEINAKIDKLIIDPRAFRSWIQQWFTLLKWSNINQSIKNMEDKMISSAQTIQFKNLLKSPWNFQTSRQSMLKIFRGLDTSSGNMDRNSESYKDLTKDEMAKSIETYNSTYKDKETREMKSLYVDMQNIINNKAHIDHIKEMIIDGKKEKDIKSYLISTLPDKYTRKDGFLKEKVNYLFDIDEIEKIVKGVKDMIKNKDKQKEKIKNDMLAEKNKISKMVGGDLSKLNQDGQDRYNYLNDLLGIGQVSIKQKDGTTATIELEKAIDVAYDESMDYTIWSTLGHYMSYNLLHKTWLNYGKNKWNMKSLYGDILWVGWKVSDEVSNIMANSAIEMATEIVIAVIAFAASAATFGAWWVAIYGARLAAKRVSKTLIRKIFEKIATYWVRWTLFTLTSESLRNLKTASDRSNYAEWFTQGFKDNFISNTAMLGILKVTHWYFNQVKTLKSVSWNIPKNMMINASNFLIAEVGIAWVDFWSKKYLLGKEEYTDEDFINTLAENLAFELIAEWLGLPIKVRWPSKRSNSQSVIPVEIDWKQWNIVIKEDGAVLQWPDSKPIKKVNITKAIDKRLKKIDDKKQNIDSKKKENIDLKNKKTELNKQKKQLEKEINNKKYWLEKWTQPELWTKEILDRNINDMIKWLNGKLKGKTIQEIENNPQLAEYSMILELFNGYKVNGSTKNNAKAIVDKLNTKWAEWHYTEPNIALQEKRQQLTDINKQIKAIDKKISSNDKNIKDKNVNTRKNWAREQKQRNTYSEQIKLASELVHQAWDKIDGVLSKLKDIDNLTRDDIRAIQRELGMKWRAVDGILWPKTLEVIKKHIDSRSKVEVNKQDDNQQSKESDKVEDSKKAEEKPEKNSLFDLFI